MIQIPAPTIKDKDKPVLNLIESTWIGGDEEFEVPKETKLIEKSHSVAINSQSSLLDDLAVFKKPNWSETEKSIFKSLYP